MLGLCNFSTDRSLRCIHFTTIKNKIRTYTNKFTTQNREIKNLSLDNTKTKGRYQKLC